MRRIMRAASRLRKWQECQFARRLSTTPTAYRRSFRAR
jgi:hypothetical protein